MRIAVQLSESADRSLRARAHDEENGDPLSALAREMHVSLEPTHPDSSDPAMRSWYSVDVADAATAQAVVNRLLEQPDVLAAYVKPPDALP